MLEDVRECLPEEEEGEEEEVGEEKQVWSWYGVNECIRGRS